MEVKARKESVVGPTHKDSILGVACGAHKEERIGFPSFLFGFQ